MSCNWWVTYSKQLQLWHHSRHRYCPHYIPNPRHYCTQPWTCVTYPHQSLRLTLEEVYPRTPPRIDIDATYPVRVVILLLEDREICTQKTKLAPVLNLGIQFRRSIDFIMVDDAGHVSYVWRIIEWYEMVGGWIRCALPYCYFCLIVNHDCNWRMFKLSRLQRYYPVIVGFYHHMIQCISYHKVIYMTMSIYRLVWSIDNLWIEMIHKRW